MKIINVFLLLIVPLQIWAGWQIKDQRLLYLTGVEYTIQLENTGQEDSAGVLVFKNGTEAELQRTLVPIRDSVSTQFRVRLVKLSFPQSGTWEVQTQSGQNLSTFMVLPGWSSVLPPLAAILLALITRQVLVALFAGIWLGAFFIYDYQPFMGFLYALTEYIGKAPADPERMSILIFSLTLGGMVGVMSRAGGTQGIVSKLSRFASNRKRGQLVTWIMGVLVFFDDYANTLIVGNTMRPLTDKLKVSREKLAYLVDSTAAPVANIAIISTWIGYELSLINESFREIGLNSNAYITFFKTIPYNFYPLYTLIFGLIIALSGRDMFSMLRAERRSNKKGQLLADGALPLADMNSGELQTKSGVPLRWYNALIPIVVVILTTLIGLWLTGLSAFKGSSSLNWLEYASGVVGASNSFSVLMWAAFLGSLAAIILAMVQKILSLNEAIMAWVSGVKAMVLAGIILTLAWSIGNICSDLQTAQYVIYVTRDFLSPHFLPLLAFVISGVIAFATGTSWGTMAILAPIVIPLAWQLPMQNATIAPPIASQIFLSSIAAILAGATFGDHCSPISDTTIMSSMASGSDHIDHVRTQLPYALISAAVAILFGYLPAGFGLSGWFSFGLGVLGIFIIIRFLGKTST